MRMILLTLIFAVWSFELIAEELKGTFYFDADTTYATKDSNTKIFEGNVVAIAPGTLVSADKITHNRELGILNATGHTILISNDQVFIGDDLEFKIDTQDITINKATLVAKEVTFTQKIINDLLGFSVKEVEFEAARKERLQSLETERRQFLDDYSRLTPEEKADTYRLENYIKILTQIDSVSVQPNPWVINRPPNDRKLFLRRRDLWTKARQDQTLSGSEAVGYFRLSGATISKRHGNDYESNAVSWTPCRCEEDESPAWSIQSGTVAAQMQGYMDFYNPIIKVAGIPVLYAPFLRLPLKSSPQSGFLVPSFGGQTSTGLIVGLPAYLRFSDQSDLTVTPEILEKRGYRLGVSSDYRFSESFKFSLEGEGIRDKVWLREVGARTENRALFHEGLRRALSKERDDVVTSGSPGEQSAQLSNRSYWQTQLNNGSACASFPTVEAAKECLDQEVNRSLTTPENEWRGKIAWNGTRYFSPRLSLVTNGEIFSDHRYLEDLEVAKGFEAALAGVSYRSFAPARYRLNLDQEDYYLGAFGSYGDHSLTSSLWAGQQMPYGLKLRTRYLPIWESGVYVSGSFESRLFVDRKSNEFSNLTESGLGGGKREVVQLNSLVPLHLLSQVQTSFFLDLEGRSFSHPALPENRSTIKTAKYGLFTNLPVKGRATFADKAIHHDFNLNTTLSVRPVAERDGIYGEEFIVNDPSLGLIRNQSRRTWFASDLGLESSDLLIPADDVMIRHEKVTFQTSNQWGLFAKSNQKAFVPSTAKSYMERAKMELDAWENAPTIDGEAAIPINLSLVNSISYDRLKARKRESLEKTVKTLVVANEKAREEGREGVVIPDLPEPWSELTTTAGVNFYSTSLGYGSTWNLYKNLFTKSTYTLSLSPFERSSLTFGYELEKKPSTDSLGRFSADVIRTRSAGAQTHVIQNYNIVANYSRKTAEGVPRFKYSTTYGVEYLSPSDCWGINLVRIKEFEKEERDATWRMELNIILLGEKRGANLSKAILRAWKSPQKTVR